MSRRAFVSIMLLAIILLTASCGTKGQETGALAAPSTTKDSTVNSTTNDNVNNTTIEPARSARSATNEDNSVPATNGDSGPLALNEDHASESSNDDEDVKADFYGVEAFVYSIMGWSS